jgi:signal transduction histidine kinase
VARHAEAGHLWLQLDGAGDRLDLEIRDGRFGLVAMQERVEMAGGPATVRQYLAAGCSASWSCTSSRSSSAPANGCWTASPGSPSSRRR